MNSQARSATVKQNRVTAMVRCVHLLFSVPIIGYIYSPFDQIPNYAGPTRYLFLPAMIVSGLWMWISRTKMKFLSKPSLPGDENL
jgi:hypothetical protein